MQRIFQYFYDQYSSPPVELKIIGNPPPHAGYGSRTSLLLAFAQALSIITGANLAPFELVSLTHRGGVSGVGVNTFFSGGFIWDVGHPSEEVVNFEPSSQRIPSRPPAALVRGGVPPEWPLFLIETGKQSLHGADELAFFQRNTPICSAEVYETLAIFAHGLVPGLLEKRFGPVRSSLRRLHEIGFKKRELDAASRECRSLYDLLKNADCAIGLSSLGPLLYGFLRPGSDFGPELLERTVSDQGFAVQWSRVAGAGASAENIL
jgi:beta-ribofuranosylaminobenzene 5'-phosphate synthase